MEKNGRVLITRSDGKRRYMHPDPGKRRARGSVQYRFELKVERIPGVDCHIWTGFVGKNCGYGYIGTQGKVERAHRVAFKVYRGEIPEGLFVCHTCDVRTCVNPEHLFLGDHAVNQADMIKKGRQRGAPGTANSHNKVTESEVRAIRLDTRVHRIIGEQYGVLESNINHIKSGISWKRLP